MPFADTGVDGAEAAATAEAEAGDEAQSEIHPEEGETREARAPTCEGRAAEAEGRADRATGPRGVRGGDRVFD